MASAFGQSTEPTWSPAGFATTSTQTWRNGNVGIGIANAPHALTLNSGNANISLGGNIFINGQGSTGRISNNAYQSNGNWAIADNTAKASTIELRDNGIIEMYGSLTNGQANWNCMFGMDAPNNKVYFPSGNVGIGIGSNTPSQKLEVGGYIKSNGLVFPDGTIETTANPFSYSSTTVSLKTQNTWTFQAAMIVVDWGQTLNQVKIGAPLVVSGGVSAGGDVSIGGNMRMTGGITSNINILESTGYDNTDPMWIGRVNNGANKSEMRISLGDDLNTADDFLSFGVNSAANSGAWKTFASLNTLGEFRTKKSIVTQVGWADYVFEKDHQIMSLSATESYIKTNKKLPGIPSAKEVEEKGIDTGEMLKLQMEKIEELYLHSIEQQKKITALEQKLSK